MQSYLKIYPKHMELNNVDGRLSIKLCYCVEQYGLMTGPFNLRADFQHDMQMPDADPWVVMFNSCPRHSALFNRFFSYLHSYIQKFHGSCPLDDICSGKIRFFEIYFPKIYYKYSSLHQGQVNLNALFYSDHSGVSQPMSLAA